MLEFYRKNNIFGTPFVLAYTPEQLASFLLDETIIKLSNNEIPGKLGSHSSKIHVYNNQPYFKLGERKKLHGFELVESSEIFKHNDFRTLENRYKTQWRECWFDVHDFRENLKLGNSVEANLNNYRDYVSNR